MVKRGVFVANKFLIVDGSSLIHRAFFALPLLATPNGQYTNAVYGLAMMLKKILKQEDPKQVAICLDKSRQTFRTEMYEGYKQQRLETPSELRPQFELAKEMLEHLGLAWVELAGYEADDIIGTLARQAAKANDEVLILTGDKDTLQLIDDKIKVMTTQKGITDVKVWDEAALDEKFGLTPNQIIDLKALMGDSSDNIPGVPGVGEKTALNLLHAYGNLANIFANLAQITPPGVQNKLRENEELAKLSYQLATIDCDVPVERDLKSYNRRPQNTKALREFYQNLGFKSLLADLPAGAVPADFQKTGSQGALMPWVELLPDEKAVAELAQTLEQQQTVSLWLEHKGSAFEGNMVSLGLALADGRSFGLEVFGFLETTKLQPLAGFLANESIKKIVHHSKEAQVILARNGLKLQGVVADTALAAYLLDPALSKYEVASLAQKYLGDEPAAIAANVWENAGKMASLLFPLAEKLAAELALQPDMKKLYEGLELPLAAILAEMELTGIKVDSHTLKELAAELATKAATTAKQIYAMAGHEFNINSPKQMGQVLFEEMKINPVKKGKTGYSTDAEVLEILAKEQPIAAEILQYRTCAKLNSTYAQGLQPLIYPDGKIHTSFNQTVTATGRLSSTEPNLQNIPIREEMSRQIRRAFLPEKLDNVFLDADYSQIELRILAHMSGDEAMCQAFRQEEDIHARTAAEVFGVPIDQVTKEQRRRAKAVNFGIIYGISDFGLAKDLGIPRWEAKEYIDMYFKRYPRVEAYLKELIATGEKEGYVATLFGRRRWLADLKNPNFNLRSFAQRMAMNAPIQGTAADIIKIAMVQVAKRLKKENLQSKLILQVHDELLFDCVIAELPQVAKIVKTEMAGGPNLAVPQLKVPIIVDLKTGPNWYNLTTYLT